MTTPPEEPPFRPPPIDGRSPRAGGPIRLAAIAAGVAADWLATFVTFFAISIVAAGIGGAENPEHAQRYMEQLMASPDFVMVSLLVGLLCTAFGGYIAARLARDDAIRHAVLVGFASLALGLMMEGARDPEVWSPTWFRLLGNALVVPFAWLGGVFAERTLPAPKDETLPS